MAIVAGDLAERSALATGLCQCGCGKPTTIADRNDSRVGVVKGHRRRYLQGHTGGATKKYDLIHCDHCLALIYPIWDSGRPRKFCNRDCYSAALAERAQDPVTRQRDWSLRRRYGISLVDFERILEVQGGGCAICGRTPEDTRLGVDHDHMTGRVRGILCPSCNRTLGYMQDNPERLRKAAVYLERA